jgi:hypothetical protein
MSRYMVVGRLTALPNFEHRAWVSWVEEITLYVRVHDLNRGSAVLVFSRSVIPIRRKKLLYA